MDEQKIQRECSVWSSLAGAQRVIPLVCEEAGSTALGLLYYLGALHTDWSASRVEADAPSDADGERYASLMSSPTKMEANFVPLSQGIGPPSPRSRSPRAASSPGKYP